MSSSHDGPTSTVDVPVLDGSFFVHMGRGQHVLCCTVCGVRVRIADRARAKSDAEADHQCGMACGCWSADVHQSANGCEADDA